MNDDEKKISLLPEEMRKKESEERKRGETPREAAKFHIPQAEEKKSWVKPFDTAKKGPSFWMKVFGSSEQRMKKRKRREEEKKQKKMKREAERRKKEEELRAKKETEHRQAEAKKKSAVVKKSMDQKNVPTPSVPLPSESPRKPLPPAPSVSTQQKKSERKVPQVSGGMRVSLLSEEMLFPAEKRFASKVLVFFLTQFGIILLLLVAYFWMEWQESQVKTTEGNILEQLSSVESLIAQKEIQLKDAKTLQTQAGIFKNLLDVHVYWTQFLSGLERNTVQGVYYTSIAADAGGGAVLAAHAPNYETAARQLIAFREAGDFVSSVRMTSAVGEEGEGGLLKGVSFDIHLEIAPKVFYK